MEESIKRAEKLVHATSSALALMKYNLTFDNVNDLGKLPKRAQVSNRGKLHYALDDELKQFEEKFRSDVNEMLVKMDKFLEPSQYSAARFHPNHRELRSRMQEINRKLETKRLKQSKISETEQTKSKLSRFFDENDFKESVEVSKKFANLQKDFRPVKETHQTLENELKRRADGASYENSTGKEKPKEELKTRLLETQEIVDRGFQTVRELTQKIETIAQNDKVEKTSSSGKTVSSDDICLKSSKPCLKSPKSVTASKSPEKCNKCSRPIIKKNKKVGVDKGIEFFNDEAGERTSFLTIKRPDSEKSVSKFSYYRLPSVSIKRGLQKQMVHCLEIMPTNNEIPKANTVLEIFSHEKIEKAKVDDLMENMRNPNNLCGKNQERERRIECFNCGELLRIQRTPPDASEIDELLQKCSFNVYDPRIDEFVEKSKVCREIGKMGKVKQKEDAFNDEAVLSRPQKANFKSTQAEGRLMMKEKTFSIQDLSQRVTRMYKEKENQLENNLVKFDTIIRGLFRKIDESRELFGDCRSLRKHLEEKKSQNLVVTEPLVLCVSGSAKEKSSSDLQLDKQTNTVKSLESPDQIRRREKRRKTGKTDVKTKNCRSDFPEDLDFTISADQSLVSKSIPKPLDLRFVSLEDMQKKKLIPPSPARSSSSTKSVSVRDDLVEDSVALGSEAKTEDDYESDFEGESSPGRRDGDDYENDGTFKTEKETGILIQSNKLSTITEVDSDLERKFVEINEVLSNTPSKESNPSNELKASDKGSLSPALKHRTNVAQMMSDPRSNRTSSSLSTVISEEVKETNSVRSKSSDQPAPHKSSSTEAVLSLKEVLSALKDQFSRTQTLAEKLTENMQNLKIENQSSPVIACNRELSMEVKGLTDTEMIANLQTWKTNPVDGNPGRQKTPFSLPHRPDVENSKNEISPSESVLQKRVRRNRMDGDTLPTSLVEEYLPSVGELIVEDTKRKKPIKELISSSECNESKASNRRKLSSLSEGSNSVENHSGSPIMAGFRKSEDSYSEGEIPGNGLANASVSVIQSIGEVISERISSSPGMK